LRVSITGLTAPWSQAEIAASIPTSPKALLVPQGQHIGQSRDVTNTVDLQQCLCLRIRRLSELLNLSIVLLDLDRHLCDLLEHWTKGLCQPWRHDCQAALGETACRGSWQAIPTWLHQSAHCVHRGCAQSNQKITRTDPDIAKVNTDRHLNVGLSAWDFCDEVMRRLFHGKQSLRSGRSAHPISQY
jgi:hypothetical protein